MKYGKIENTAVFKRVKDMFDFKNKITVITGGAHAAGKCIAALF